MSLSVRKQVMTETFWALFTLLQVPDTTAQTLDPEPQSGAKRLALTEQSGHGAELNP